MSVHQTNLIKRRLLRYESLKVSQEEFVGQEITIVDNQDLQHSLESSEQNRDLKQKPNTNSKPFWEAQCIHIVIELAECGDVQQVSTQLFLLFDLCRISFLTSCISIQLLENQLKKRLYFAERDLWNYAWQICMGILHLHTRGVIHRDIKCMNLLLTDNFKTIKLGDMSESRVLDHHSYIKTKKIIGTPLSLSPEVVKQEGYDQRSDIWAMGVALYCMACLEPPF